MSSSTAARNTSGHLEHPAAGHADSVVAIHMEHERRLNPHQKAIETLTSSVGRPYLLYGIFAVSAIWVAFNLFQLRIGGRPLERPPFSNLQGFWTACSLFISFLVLITQNRQMKAESHKSQLALQLSLLSDQKTAKIIALLEELRKDSPAIPDRVDPEAEALIETISAEDLANDLEQKLNESEAEISR